jgi:hypothetical protein
MGGNLHLFSIPFHQKIQGIIVSNIAIKERRIVSKNVEVEISYLTYKEKKCILSGQSWNWNLLFRAIRASISLIPRVASWKL